MANQSRHDPLPLDLRAGYVVAGGVRTRYLRAGNGPAVMLLHGLAGVAEYWARNLGALAREFSVYAPDLLGRGFTDTPPWDDDPPQVKLVKHLLDLLDALGLERPALVASSLAASTVVQAYLQTPERISKLVIVGSGTVVNSREGVQSQLGGAGKRAERSEGTLSLTEVRKQLDSLVADSSLVPDEVALMRLAADAQPGRSDAMSGLALGLQRYAADPRFFVGDRLPEVAVETLLAWGRLDTRAPWERAVEAVRIMPDARLVIFERCGHAMFMERPAEFNQVVSDFLTGRRVDLPGSVRVIENAK